MTREAFQFALRELPVPEGKSLWLYGNASVATGDIYKPFKSQAHLQGRTVYSTLEELPGGYDAVLLNAPKQREEAEGLLALALSQSKGFVMAIAHNEAGGRRLRGMFEAFGLEVQYAAKSHCQIVWTTEAAKADKAKIKEQLQKLAPREQMLGGRKWWSAPGLFGWDKIDQGSQYLLDSLPADITGKVADFGVGYGYISTIMAERYPAIGSIDAYDNDARAVACCKLNAPAKVIPIWQDIRELSAPRRYDFIAMNPPFHTGSAENVELGKIFIEKAIASLRPNGRMFMVANIHLPYEKTVPGLRILKQEQGYKIITGRGA